MRRILCLTKKSANLSVFLSIHAEDYTKTIKLYLTISDLLIETQILSDQVLESVQYQQKSLLIGLDDSSDNLLLSA